MTRSIARSMTRRTFVAGLGAGAALIAARPSAIAACRGVGTRAGIGADFWGGLETRHGINIGYFPFRVESPAGGTWLYSGDYNGTGKRIAWLPNGVEVGLTSTANVGSCNSRNGVEGNCASNSPPLRPSAHGSQWNWCYPDRFPAAGTGAIAAPTSDQGWIDAHDLVFAGYGPHTIKRGPAGRDFEVHTAACDGYADVAYHGLPSPRWGGNIECNTENSCTEGVDDCVSDDGREVFYGEGSSMRSRCLGGYEYSSLVSGGHSPDMRDGDRMPLSYLFFAPRSNTKTYLHAGDVVKVIYRKTIDIPHRDAAPTRSTWYGVEIVESQCPFLAPVGVRGWVMAFSEWDQMVSGRGLFFESVG